MNFYMLLSSVANGLLVSSSSNMYKTYKHIKVPLLATCFTLVSCLASSSSLKMEAPCYCEMLADFQQTIQSCIPASLQRENLYSSI
jgi:hypothetical protein